MLALDYRRLADAACRAGAGFWCPLVIGRLLKGPLAWPEPARNAPSGWILAERFSPLAAKGFGASGKNGRYRFESMD